MLYLANIYDLAMLTTVDMCTCVTCGKQGHWKTGGIQAGHFMSRKALLSTRWDESSM